MKSYIIILILSLLSQPIFSQIVIDRQLIGSGYSEFNNGSTFTLSASIGEPIVKTAETTSLIITQGFQQSNYILAEPLIADLEATKAACIGANNGSVSIAFVSTQLSLPLSYAWSNGATTDTISQLEVGQYSVTITGANGKSITNTVTVGALDSVDCKPGFYTGITPNNDGSNDFWSVDNSEYFTTKKVQIFNRYGLLVWNTENYDNFGNRFDGTHQNGESLPDGTYFFIAKFDDSSYRGWIEISR